MSEGQVAVTQTRPARRLGLAAQLGLLALGSAVLAAVLLVGPLSRHDAANAEVVAEAPVPPGAFRATDGQWQSLSFLPAEPRSFQPMEETDGKIANNDDATTPVFSPYSGRVTRIFAKAGDRVAAGQPLLAVEASEFVQGQNDLIAAQAQVNTARAQLRLAEAAEKRSHDLLAAGGGSQRDWQQSQSDLAAARGSLRTAEIGLAAARNRLVILGKSDAEIRALETSGDSGRIHAESVVRAPIAGVVSQRQVGVGQYIGSGSATPVFSITDPSTVWLVANVREADAPRIHGGEAVEVAVLAYPGQVFHARLSYVAPAIDPQTRRLPVRAVIENSGGALKPEMFARFRILTGEGRESLAVPVDAVIYEGDKARVWVAGGGHTLSLRPIVTGRTSGGMVEVVSGLTAGTQVVTAGALFIDRAGKGN